MEEASVTSHFNSPIWNLSIIVQVQQHSKGKRVIGKGVVYFLKIALPLSGLSSPEMADCFLAFVV